MSKRIVFFNHKGGVSKTTSAYNIGWILARSSNVLLVDADPQCNLTSLILADDFENYYLDDATRLQNIKDGSSAAFDGRPTPISAVTCQSHPRAPRMRLLAGHMNLSEYDAALTFAQTSNNAITTLQNLPGAFSELIRRTEEAYDIDYTIIDLNPSLSAINQNLFLVSDFFIIPTNPDPFSIMALDTLQRILPRWVHWKNTAQSLFADSAYPLPEGTPRLVGTLIQRFNIRKGRAARPYRDNISEIKAKMAGSVFPALRGASMTFDPQVYGEPLMNSLCLGEIPDFQGLLPKSHSANVPVFALTDEEIDERGSVLEGFREKRDTFYAQFESIGNSIVHITDNA